MVDILPLQFLLATWAGWVNRRQLEVIEYLRAENQVLKAQVGRRRLRLTNDQRRRLAAKGHRLGRRVPQPRAPGRAIDDRENPQRARD